MKKVAIIGSGISGLSSAYYLNQKGFEVHLFEANDYFGGHTNTINIEEDGKTIPVDTGFLVHNNHTYPNLIPFLKELNISTHESEMSFSVEHEVTKLVWAGTNLGTVFAQRSNLWSPRFFSFLNEILKFNRNSTKYLNECLEKPTYTLGELLNEKGYSQNFRDWYLLPMGGCIWSTPINKMLEFPAQTFLRFCKNHGLLQIFNRPQWKTISGGCRRYVEEVLKQLTFIYKNEPVSVVTKKEDKLLIKSNQRELLVDFCIFATHPPQTVEIFKSIDNESLGVLETFKYQKNTAILHFDEEILPENKKAWAAWNYYSSHNDQGEGSVSVSYLINLLQPIDTKKNIIVTLNPNKEIDETKIYKTIDYEHPLFDAAAIESQGKISSIQGKNGVYYCGAWGRYGFHEDGILMAKHAVNRLFEAEGLEGIEVFK